MRVAAGMTMLVKEGSYWYDYAGQEGQLLPTGKGNLLNSKTRIFFFNLKTDCCIGLTC